MRRLVTGWVAGTLIFAVACDEPPPPPPNDSSVEVIRPIQLAPGAFAPEQDRSLVDVEVFPDRLVFHYSAAPSRPPREGDVVAGVRGGGYLRRILSTTRPSDTAVDAVTEHAYLTDYIADGAFRVQQIQEQDVWVEGDVGATPGPLHSRLQLLSPTTTNGLTCGVASESDLDVTPVLEAAIDTDILVDISGSTLREARFVASGTLDAGVHVRSLVAGSFMCELDVIEWARARLGPDRLKFRMRPIVFFVGPIPVIITQTIEPVLQLASSVRAGIAGADNRFVVTFGIRAGAEYRDGSWQGVWEPRRTSQLMTSVPSEVGDVTVETSVSGGIGYRAFVYDAVGPKIDLLGVIRGETIYDVPMCTWNSTLDTGIRVSLGGELRVPVIDRSLVEWTQDFDLLSTRIDDASGMFASCGDAGMSDGGGPDGGEPDAGEMDAGEMDAGEMDAGEMDAGGMDAGGMDAGMIDAGMTDAGPPDCGSELTLCSTSCVNTLIDDANCGGCDNACGAGQHCCNGSCGSTQLCDGACVDTSTNPGHCGACDRRCGPGTNCCNGSCEDFITSERACGGCGLPCGAGQECCGGGCVNVQYDPRHCGGCGTLCGVTQGCCGGSCVDPGGVHRFNGVGGVQCDFCLGNGVPCGEGCAPSCACPQGGRCLGPQQCTYSVLNCITGECFGANSIGHDPRCTGDDYCQSGQCVSCPSGPCQSGTPGSEMIPECHQGRQLVSTMITSGESLCYCHDAGPSPDGTVCITGSVLGTCQGGACIRCTAGTRCTPPGAECSLGRMDCATGLCTDTAIPLPDGEPCGAGRTCSNGSCIDCELGAPCTPANICDRGLWDVTSVGCECRDIGPMPDGTECGENMVCDTARCEPCTTGASCVPPGGPCQIGTLNCSLGFPVCMATASTAPDGTVCAADSVCNAGNCVACPDGQRCTPDDVCNVGEISCDSGSPECIDTEAPNDGVACGTNRYCRGGECLTCNAGEGCTLPNCHEGIVSCITGDAVCGDTGRIVPNGTSCGTDRVCNGGACAPCVAGQSCATADPCELNGQTSCATGASQCVPSSLAANGTTCGVDRVCRNGVCSACAEGSACVPGTCRTGTTSCTTGSPVCVDTGMAAEGTSCGSNQVCTAGACVSCIPGRSCTPADPCMTGTESCSAGRTCVAGAPASNGTPCGTNMVCNAGACVPCTAGAACTPANPCHDGVTECSTGTSACLDTGRESPDHTSCGAADVCLDGICRACTTTCMSGCTDTSVDPANCGVCETVCAADQSCIDGSCTSALCFPPSFGWAAVTGGAPFDTAVDVASDALGNVYYGGTGGATLTGYAEARTVDGGLRWRRPLMPMFAGSTTVTEAIATDGTTVYVAGAFTGSAFFVGGLLMSRGGSDGFLLALGTDGSFQWLRQIGGTADDRVLALAVGPGGALYVAGLVRGSGNLGGGPTTGTSGQDIFVARWSTAGAFSWANRYGNDAFDNMVNAVGADAAGNVVFAGTADGSINLGGALLGNSGQRDLFVASVTDLGAHNWSNTWGSAGVDTAAGLAVTAAGETVVAGTIAASVELGGGPLPYGGGSSDGFVFALTPGGAHHWSRSIGGPGTDDAYGVAIGSSGIVYVAGTFRGAVDFGAGSVTPSGGADGYVILFTAEGAPCTARTVGGGGLEALLDVSVDPFANFSVAGQLNGVSDYGDGPRTSMGYDALVVQSRP